MIRGGRRLREKIAECIKRGQLQRAYDLCMAELERAPDDLWLRHRAVLCLIRSGALERAENAYARFRLDEAVRDEDCLALGARLTKAKAFEAQGEAYRALSAEAARRYQSVFEQTGGHYPAVNAASMYLLAGETGPAQDMARKALDACRLADEQEPELAYYAMASRAEASLVLGDPGAAHIALRSAISLDPDNHAAHAVTLRQFRLLAAEHGRSLTWLEELEPPRPAHFAGRLFRTGKQNSAISAEAESGLAGDLDALMEARRIGSVYGALAAGSDIMIAEAALRRGSELHVVLPVPVAVFVAASVSPLGGDWEARFEACLGAAVSVREMSRDRRLQSQLQIRFASEIAMGLARMRADVLATRPVQLLIMDQPQDDVASGTAHDREVWSAAGLEQDILPIDPASRYRAETMIGELRQTEAFDYRLRAMLFIDVVGSSAVPDDRTPAFVEGVLGHLTRTCETLNPLPLYTDSWGDGIFLGFDDVDDAARAAAQLMAAFDLIDLAELGMPEHLALRIGGHYGPVHLGLDPMQKRESLFGNQVAIAARIEPRAVPGSIFVSEAFAAALAMHAADDFRCEYVGQTRIDAHFPTMQLFSLRAVSHGAPAGARPTLSAERLQSV